MSNRTETKLQEARRLLAEAFEILSQEKSQAPESDEIGYLEDAFSQTCQAIASLDTYDSDFGEIYPCDVCKAAS